MRLLCLSGILGLFISILKLEEHIMHIQKPAGQGTYGGQTNVHNAHARTSEPLFIQPQSVWPLPQETAHASFLMRGIILLLCCIWLMGLESHMVSEADFPEFLCKLKEPGSPSPISPAAQSCTYVEARNARDHHLVSEYVDSGRSPQNSQNHSKDPTMIVEVKRRRKVSGLKFLV